MIDRRTIVTVGTLLILALSACGRDMPGDLPLTGSPSAQGLNQNAGGDIAGMQQPDELLARALERANEKIAVAEPQLLAGCQHSNRHQATLQWALERFSSLLGSVDIAGAGRSGALSRSTHPSGGTVDVHQCSYHASAPPLNAVATPNAVMMMEPLLDAFAETAARWSAIMASQQGAPSEQVLPRLAEAAGNIFVSHHQGYGFQTASADQVFERLQTDSVANGLYKAAVAFVLFHELGHVNLHHGVLKCSVAFGVEDLLQQAGVQLSQEQSQAMAVQMAAITRATETQADIYGLTLLRALGDTEGVGPLMFVMGIGGLRAQTECAHTTGDARTQCVNQTGPTDTHPPLNERAQLARRILIDGEDLSHMLQKLSVPGVTD